MRQLPYGKVPIPVPATVDVARRQPPARAPFERLVHSGLRLNESRSESELHELLIDEAAELSGAQRVLLVLDTEDGLRIAGSMLPQGEDAAGLLGAIGPWLAETRRTRAAACGTGPMAPSPPPSARA